MYSVVESNIFFGIVIVSRVQCIFIPFIQWKFISITVKSNGITYFNLFFVVLMNKAHKFIP